MNPRCLIATTTTVLGSLFLLGCASPQPGYAPFFKEPHRYSRVAIAHIDIQMTGELHDKDRSFTPSERAAWIRDIEVSHVQTFLSDRGYTLVQPIPPCTISTTNSINEWTALLLQLQSFAIKNRENEKPYDHRVSLSGLNIPNRNRCDAILILSTHAQFESLQVRSKRIKQTIIASPFIAAGFALGAAAVVGGGMPLVPNFHTGEHGVRHNYSLLDAKTGQILWCNWRLFEGENARSRGVLEGTTEDMFEHFPEIQNQGDRVTSKR